MRRGFAPILVLTVCLATIILIIFLFVPLPYYQTHEVYCKLGSYCPQRGFHLGVPLWKQIYPFRFSKDQELTPIDTKSPTPSPTSDETANWKTFSRTDFTIKYPPEWTLQDDYAVIIRGPQGELSIVDQDYGFSPSIEDFKEQKSITVPLKYEQLEGVEFVYTNRGFFVASKNLPSGKCLCINANYESYANRQFLLKILKTLETK